MGTRAYRGLIFWALLVILIISAAPCHGRSPHWRGAPIPPGLQAFTLHSRNTCFVVSGADFSSGARTISAGLPGPDLDSAQNCVESGHDLDPGSGVVFVDFDNPRIWTNFLFGGVHTQWNGTMPQELFTTTMGWRCANCDLSMEVMGGTGPSMYGTPQFANGVSGSRQSLSDSPLLWTANRPGHWGESGARRVSLISEGVRVGHRKVETQLFVTLPNEKSMIGGFPASIQLDPLVLLVPVQVFVLLSPDQANPSWDLSHQLALWDRVPTQTDLQRTSDPQFGELTSATHSLANWVDGGEKGPAEAQVNGRFLPDDVWAPCGVQFRLVNYTEISTTAQNVNPQGENLDLQTPLRENFDLLIRTDPHFVQGIPTVVFVQRCTPVEAAEPGQLSEPLGISLPNDAVSCISTSKTGSEVVAHELGHVMLGSNSHPDCPSNLGDLNNVMCAVNGGAAVTSRQCSDVRAHIAGQHWVNFFR